MSFLRKALSSYSFTSCSNTKAKYPSSKRSSYRTCTPRSNNVHEKGLALCSLGCFPSLRYTISSSSNGFKYNVLPPDIFLDDLFSLSSIKLSAPTSGTKPTQHNNQPKHQHHHPLRRACRQQCLRTLVSESTTSLAQLRPEKTHDTTNHDSPTFCLNGWSIASLQLGYTQGILSNYNSLSLRS